MNSDKYRSNKLQSHKDIIRNNHHNGGDDDDHSAANSFSSVQSSDTPNLLRLLAQNAWKDLEKQISHLSTRPELVLASMSITDSNDFSTPLHVASWKAPPHLALKLLSLLDDDTSPDTKGVLLACDKDGNTALHLCAANLQPNLNSKTNARELFDTSVLVALAKKASDAIVMQNSQGDSPLHLLVTTIYPKVLQGKIGIDESLTNAIKQFVKLNPKVCLVSDSTGATPLHTAIASGANLNILNTILEVLKAPSAKEDNLGMLPLHYVAAFAKTPPSFIESLVTAHPAAVTSTTINGDTPLHLAISNANTTLIKNGKIDKEALSILQALIDKHETKNDSKDSCPLFIMNKEKLTPLHCCALFDAPSALTKIVMKDPMGSQAASLVNSFGATPLHLAVAQPGVAVSITSIVTLGTPEAAAVQDRLKRTPLHIACQNVHATGSLIRALIKLNPESASIPTSKGHLPLHLAVQSQAKDSVVKELIKAYPEGVKQINKSENMPLHDACKYKASVSVVELLLEANPNALKIPNAKGDLPIHCATAYKSDIKVLKLLLDAYPEGVSKQNKNQETPIHYAAVTVSSNSLEVLKLLIKASPGSIKLQNSKGENPVEKAKNSSSSDKIPKEQKNILQLALDSC